MVVTTYASYFHEPLKISIVITPVWLHKAENCYSRKTGNAQQFFNLSIVSPNCFFAEGREKDFLSSRELFEPHGSVVKYMW